MRAMFRCYRQTEHSDCGLACIRMIARSYGKRIPMRYLRGASDLNRLGMSIKDVISCCNAVGMDAAAVSVGIDKIRDMPLPAILYWQQRHFVVLYGHDAKRGRFRVADPAQGKLAYNEEDFKRYWIPEGRTAGLAILAEPNDRFSSMEFGGSNDTRDFTGYLLPLFRCHMRGLLAALLITVLIMAADLAAPLLLRMTVDEGIGLRDTGLVLSLLLTQLCIALGGLAASGAMNLIITKTGLGMHLEMANRFLERLARFPLSYFDRKVSSDFVQKISDQSRIRNFLMSVPNSTIIAVLSIAVFASLLLHYSALVFALFISLSLTEIAWNALFLNRRRTIDYAFFTHSSENRNHAYELTNGMADLKVNNAERSRIAKWRETQDAINRASMKSAWLGAIQGGGQSAISRIRDLAVTGAGAVLVINGEMTMGTLMTLGYITGRLSQPFSTLSSSITSLQDAMLSYRRIEDVVSDDSELRGDAGYSEPTIELDGVSFKYPGAASPYVIRDFSLKVGKGDVIALVGESGCGKSTLIKLMLGFYIPQKGRITLSGHDVRDMDNAAWLRHCGAVMQEARIFSGSILENVSMSDEKPDADKAADALRAAGLDGFVRSLPMGMHTRIGVSGIEMSGGQKQRLMIARALYKDPDILFLDEATSSLDANNERAIVESISNLRGTKTVVIAAHRLSTVQNADRIVFIKDGRIAETGKHDELVSNESEYWRLVRNQLQLSV